MMVTLVENTCRINQNIYLRQLEGPMMQRLSHSQIEMKLNVFRVLEPS
jgi:hypothetical protein